MPTVQIISVLPRMLSGVALVALLASACSTSVSGEANPEPEAPSVQASPPTATPPSGASGTCRVTASSSGSISSSGAGGKTMTTNGRTSFSCGSGPLVGIESIDASGVTFSAGGATVPVAPGAAATVGAYRISVASSDANSAEFQVEPAN